MNPGDTCTPIYGLPYATGASKPCNIGSTMCDFASAVDAQLTAMDAVTARTATTIPISWVQTTTAFTIVEDAGTTTTAAFDTIIVDTDNMVNLTSDNTGPTVTRDGIYLVWYYFHGVVTTSASGLSFFVNPFVAPITALGTQTTPTIGFTSYLQGWALQSSAMYPLALPAGTHVGLTLDQNGTVGDVITMDKVDLGLAWVSDLP